MSKSGVWGLGGGSQPQASAAQNIRCPASVCCQVLSTSPVPSMPCSWQAPPLSTHTPEPWELPTGNGRVKQQHQAFKEDRKSKAGAQLAEHRASPCAQANRSTSCPLAKERSCSVTETSHLRHHGLEPMPALTALGTPSAATEISNILVCRQQDSSGL